MSTSNTIFEYEDDEEFRNSIATVDKDGKRIWLYPKRPKGRFYNKRIIATIVFLALFFSGPLVKINGLPLLMLNIFERKFVIFGKLFLPQDFVIFGLGMIIFVVFIILFTVSFGRIWCGWLCPQTVFLEMIFRPIENLIEGDGRNQKKFDEGVWNFNKIWRKTLKHIIYLVFSSVIAHFTMAYLIGDQELIKLISNSPFNNLPTFSGLVIFTLIFYFVFTKLREQVCIAICPYGRLQGVLVNNDTMNVMYDELRGEPRSRISKQILPNNKDSGDCIDCKLCVQVCPTGIDIRNGIQLECVNCTACIDACDDVMEKIGKPKNLIKYGSVNSIKNSTAFKLSSRIVSYIVVLFVLIGLESFLLLSRSDVETTILRVPGQLFQEKSNSMISNLYNAQIVNKTNSTKSLTIRCTEPRSNLKIIGNSQKVIIEPSGRNEVVFFLEIPKKQLKNRKNKIEIEIIEDTQIIETKNTNFLGPN